MIIAAILVIFPFCMAYAAVSDLLSMTIANRVSVLLVATFAVAAPFAGLDWATIGTHFATAGGVLAVTFVLFALGTMGGGDAKLLASTSLWFGFGMPLLEYMLTSAILGGALTMAILFYRNSAIAVYSGHVSFLQKIANNDEGIPYGIALGASGLITFPNSILGGWVLEQLGSI